MQIGELIKNNRVEHKMSLRSLAKELEISHPYLSQIEKGERKASPDLLERLSKIFNISHNELMEVAGYIKKYEDNGIQSLVNKFEKTDNAIEQKMRLSDSLSKSYHAHKNELETLLKIQQKKIDEEMNFRKSLNNSIDYNEKKELLKTNLKILEEMTEINKKIDIVKQSMEQYVLQLQFIDSELDANVSELNILKEKINSELENTLNKYNK